MQIIGIRYKSTNCFFIYTGAGLLAFDAGWPGTYGEYRDNLKAEGYSVKEIKWLIVSHFHMDHAGLAGVLVNNGVDFIVFRNQLHAIDDMEALIMSKNMAYTMIDQSMISIKELHGSRTWLKSIGIDGEVILTDGHGDHHVSLLLDSGDAFTGDLPPENALEADDRRAIENWTEIRKLGVSRIWPAHAPAYTI